VLLSLKSHCETATELLAVYSHIRLMFTTVYGLRERELIVMS
jgi:hypothetical protein